MNISITQLYIYNRYMYVNIHSMNFITGKPICNNCSFSTEKVMVIELNIKKGVKTRKGPVLS